MREPDKFEVLAWLMAEPSRTSTQAAKRYWPHASEPSEVRRLGNRIRKWAELHRKGSEEPRVAEPSRPAPQEVGPSTDRRGWMAGQLEQLAADIEYARAKHDWPAVNQLTGRASSLALELDALVRVPPPAETPEAPRPLLSDAQLVTLTDTQLAVVIRGLADLRLTDEDIAATIADAALAARAIEARAARMVQDALDLEAEIDLEVGDAPLGSGTEVVQADIAAPLSGPAVRVSPFVRPGKKR